MKNSSIQEVLQKDGYEELVRMYMDGSFVVPRSGPVIIRVDYNKSLDDMMGDCDFRCISHHLKLENYPLEEKGRIAYEIEFTSVYPAWIEKMDSDEDCYPPFPEVVCRPLIHSYTGIPWQKGRIEHLLELHKRFPLEATISPIFALGSRFQKPTEYAHAPRISFPRPQDLESEPDLHLVNYEEGKYAGRSLLVRPVS